MQYIFEMKLWSRDNYTSRRIIILRIWRINKIIKIIYRTLRYMLIWQNRVRKIARKYMPIMSSAWFYINDCLWVSSFYAELLLFSFPFFFFSFIFSSFLFFFFDRKVWPIASLKSYPRIAPSHDVIGTVHFARSLTLNERLCCHSFTHITAQSRIWSTETLMHELSLWASMDTRNE